MSTGRNKRRSAAGTALPGIPLAVGRIASGSLSPPRTPERRFVEFPDFERVYLPSLILDYTLLTLRQAGVHGSERFVVWAGTIAGKTAHVSSLVLPKASGSSLHGEIPADVAGRLFESLDTRDLVPIAQVHSHPAGAFLSVIDEERPLVAITGFLSLVVPEFGYVPDGVLKDWGAFEYLDKRRWRELSRTEKAQLFVIDDSVIRVS